jgi:hypothetical protein
MAITDKFEQSISIQNSIIRYDACILFKLVINYLYRWYCCGKYSIMCGHLSCSFAGIALIDCMGNEGWEEGVDVISIYYFIFQS